MMKIEEIRKALVGKTYSFYSTWYGSGAYFKIGSVQKRGKYVELVSTESSTYKAEISMETAEALVKNGEKKHESTVDCCDVIDIWKVTNN